MGQSTRSEPGGTNPAGGGEAPGGWIAGPRVPGAILLGGFVTGGLPLWLARGATRGMAGPMDPAGTPSPGDPARGTGAGPAPPGPGGTAATGTTLGLALAVAARPLRRLEIAAAVPPDPLQAHMARTLRAAWEAGTPLPPLAAAWDAALALGGWPRAVAMALGGLRWAGPPPAGGLYRDPAGDAGGIAAAGLSEDSQRAGPTGGGSESWPQDGAPRPRDEGEGWPTPRAARRAAALAAVRPGWVRPLRQGLLLVWPAGWGGGHRGEAAAPGGGGVLPGGTGPARVEWRWAAAWVEGGLAGRPDAGPALAGAVAREAAWLEAWRRRLPPDLPADPRPGQAPGGGTAAPGAPPPAGPSAPAPSAAEGAAAAAREAAAALAALLQEAARLGRFFRDEGLVPPDVAEAGRRLDEALARLGWGPDRPASPPAWPAWHLALPVWVLWLAPAGAAGGERLRHVAGALARMGWCTCRLIPVGTPARIRLVAAGSPPVLR